MPVGRRGRPSLISTAARTAVIAGTAQAVTGNVAAKQQAQTQAQAQAQAQGQGAPPAPVAPAAGGELVAQLERLAQLNAAGVLTAEEFAAAKAQLLS